MDDEMLDKLAELVAVKLAAKLTPQYGAHEFPRKGATYPIPMGYAPRTDLYKPLPGCGCLPGTICGNVACPHRAIVTC